MRPGWFAKRFLSRSVAALALAASPGSAAGPIGFHAPWDPASTASLAGHGSALGVVVPAWISVTGPDHRMTVIPDPAGHAALAEIAARPKLWIMVQNALGGTWDGAGAAALLRDSAASDEMLDRLETAAIADRASGIVIDFEDLPPSAQPELETFLAKTRDRAHRHGWTLAVTAPVADRAYPLAAMGAVTDRVILMAYDEHWQTGQPGPIASTGWFRSAVTAGLARLPRGRGVVAVASYAYDWPAAEPATVLSVTAARALADRQGVPLLVDRDSGEPHFSYVENGVAHQVWIADAASTAAQLAIARGAGAANVALWRLGTEDPQLWTGPLR